MKRLLFLLFVTTGASCLHRNKPVVSTTRSDTALPIFDTVVKPAGGEQFRIQDSLNTKHERDSFYAIRPVKVFSTDEKGEAYYKMIAAMIDTTGITKTPVAFSEKLISKKDKDGYPELRRRIYKNSHFLINVYYEQEYGSRRFYINGRELRPGREIDTSLSGTSYIDYLEIYADNFAMIKFGTKEYLFFSGGVEKCNGMGCGVGFYILYDPVIEKGMVLQQFRSEFLIGFDRKNNTPLFIDMDESSRYYGPYGCFMYYGKVYRLNHSGKIQAVTNKSGQQYYFSGHSGNDSDSILITDGNFPHHKP